MHGHLSKTEIYVEHHQLEVFNDNAGSLKSRVRGNDGRQKLQNNDGRVHLYTDSLC